MRIATFPPGGNRAGAVFDEHPITRDERIECRCSGEVTRIRRVELMWRATLTLLCGEQRYVALRGMIPANQASVAFVAPHNLLLYHRRTVSLHILGGFDHVRSGFQSAGGSCQAS